MRAFIPVIPSGLVLAYLGLQMEALQREKAFFWFAMAAFQLFALAIFPYATLMMAGLTAFSVFGEMSAKGIDKTWQFPVAYGLVCVVFDAAFLMRGSIGFYQNSASPIRFQPQLIPHLIGGNWLLVVGLTVAIGFVKAIPTQVRWPLVGLGATNALLILGDVFVPATTILLSHHAGHFVHLTMAIHVTFIVAQGLGSWNRSYVLVILIVVVIFNGALLARGTYQGFLQMNREVTELRDLKQYWNPQPGDLVIARSKNVDDSCGWIVLMSPSPVLFCTDAEVMLTPQQNREIHRFREALYLYFGGEDSIRLQRELNSSDPSALMYRLGYWAEASSSSSEERKKGVHDIESELIPLLQKVEKHDGIEAFLQQFNRIIVVDTLDNHTFDRDRLASFMKLQSQQNVGDHILLFNSPSSRPI
jgi:hypothetical protein